MNKALCPELFIVTDEDVVLNTTELRVIPEFKAIIISDKGSKGDHDGRLKLLAFKKIKIVHEFAYPDSYCKARGLSEKDALAYCVEAFGLPADFKIDKELRTAINFYKKYWEDELPSIRLYHELTKGLKNTGDIVQELNNHIRESLDNLRGFGSVIDMTDDSKAGTTKKDIIKGIIDMQEKLNGIAAKAPETLEVIESVFKKVQAEKSNSSLIAGDKKKGNRADPTNRA